MFKGFGIGKKTKPAFSKREFLRKPDRNELFNTWTAECPSCSSIELRPMGAPEEMAGFHCVACGREIPMDEILKNAAILDGPSSCDLLEQPEFAAAVGTIAASSARLEQELCIATSFVLRAPLQGIQNAFFSLNNNRARIDLLEAGSASMPGADKHRGPLLTLLQRVRTANSKRNVFVHGAWGKRSVGDSMYILDNQGAYAKAKYRKVGIQELKDVYNELSAVRCAISDWTMSYGMDFPIPFFEEQEDHLPYALLRKFGKLSTRLSQGIDRLRSKK